MPRADSGKITRYYCSRIIKSTVNATQWNYRKEETDNYQQPIMKSIDIFANVHVLLSLFVIAKQVRKTNDSLFLAVFLAHYNLVVATYTE